MSTFVQQLKFRVRMPHKSTDIISSLAKGLRVLECFGVEAPRLSISEVSKMTDLDRATARRCLLTPHAEGYAEYDGKFFTLTPRVLRLGVGAISALPLTQIVQPWLDQLIERVGQSCSVAILDETDIVYIARAAQKRVMSIGLMPASRLPAHCTSMGRVLMSALPDPEVDRLLELSDLSPPGSSLSLTDPDHIVKRIIAARE